MQTNLTQLPLELKERIDIDTFWHHGDGDGWSFHSELLIDGATIYLNDYNSSINEIIKEINEETTGLSDDEVKNIAQFAHAITSYHFQMKPTLSAHEAYYGQ